VSLQPVDRSHVSTCSKSASLDFHPSSRTRFRFLHMNCSNVRAWCARHDRWFPFSFFIPPLVRARSEGWSSLGVRACCAHGRAEMAGSRTRNGEFSLTLQEGSVGVDELVRLDITNRDTGHVGGICRKIGVVGVRVRWWCRSREVGQM
jgi:hypothetical protein